MNKLKTIFLASLVMSKTSLSASPMDELNSGLDGAPAQTGSSTEQYTKILSNEELATQRITEMADLATEGDLSLSYLISTFNNLILPLTEDGKSSLILKTWGIMDQIQAPWKDSIQHYSNQCMDFFTHFDIFPAVMQRYIIEDMLNSPDIAEIIDLLHVHKKSDLIFSQIVDFVTSEDFPSVKRENILDIMLDIMQKFSLEPSFFQIINDRTSFILQLIDDKTSLDERLRSIMRRLKICNCSEKSDDMIKKMIEIFISFNKNRNKNHKSTRQQLLEVLPQIPEEFQDEIKNVINAAPSDDHIGFNIEQARLLSEAFRKSSSEETGSLESKIRKTRQDLLKLLPQLPLEIQDEIGEKMNEAFLTQDNQDTINFPHSFIEYFLKNSSMDVQESIMQSILNFFISPNVHENLKIDFFIGGSFDWDVQQRFFKMSPQFPKDLQEALIPQLINLGTSEFLSIAGDILQQTVREETEWGRTVADHLLYIIRSTSRSLKERASVFLHSHTFPKEMQDVCLDFLIEYIAEKGFEMNFNVYVIPSLLSCENEEKKRILIDMISQCITSQETDEQTRQKLLKALKLSPEREDLKPFYDLYENAYDKAKENLFASDFIALSLEDRTARILAFADIALTPQDQALVKILKANLEFEQNHGDSDSVIDFIDLHDRDILDKKTIYWRLFNKMEDKYDETQPSEDVLQKIKSFIEQKEKERLESLDGPTFEEEEESDTFSNDDDEEQDDEESENQIESLQSIEEESQTFSDNDEYKVIIQNALQNLAILEQDREDPKHQSGKWGNLWYKKVFDEDITLGNVIELVFDSIQKNQYYDRYYYFSASFFESLANIKENDPNDTATHLLEPLRVLFSKARKDEQHSFLLSLPNLKELLSKFAAKEDDSFMSKTDNQRIQSFLSHLRNQDWESIITGGQNLHEVFAQGTQKDLIETINLTLIEPGIRVYFNEYFKE